MADGSQLQLPIRHELVVDLFAGGGGASSGLARAYREPDVAVNHNPVAIAVHQANHPGTRHYTCDVFEVDPIEATGGQPVAVLWASPDCRHHSKAKGGKPRSKRIRGLAWVVVKWAAACKPRLIHLENVEEFADWGPLTCDGQPCKVRKGVTFRRWRKQLENLGYRVEYRELVAADYGAPTIRKRLYVIARRDGLPIVWPKPTHAKNGAGGLQPWRAAAECIDWSIQGNSIFHRAKPLAINTQKRIAKGLWRYTLNTAQPFIVKPNHTAAWYDTFRGQGIEQPLQTITRDPGFAVCQPVLAPFLTEHANASTQRIFDAQEPLRTQVAQIKGGHFSVVSASLLTLRNNAHSDDPASPLKTVAAAGQHHGVVSAHITKFRANSVGSSINEPLHTVTAGGDMVRPAGAAHAMGIVSAFFEQANGGFYDGDGRAADAPLSTICASGANQRLVTAYLVKYYSLGGQWQGCDEPMHTVPTKDRMGVVQTLQVPADCVPSDMLDKARACAAFLREHLPEQFTADADMVMIQHAGAWWVMVDITLRMLNPLELARAQGFPSDYILARGWFVDAKAPAGEWRPVSKTDQVRLIGNSVCPDVAEALIKANAAPLIKLYSSAA